MRHTLPPPGPPMCRQGASTMTEQVVFHLQSSPGHTLLRTATTSSFLSSPRLPSLYRHPLRGPHTSSCQVETLIRSFAIDIMSNSLSRSQSVMFVGLMNENTINTSQNPLWSEKYRPHKAAHVIGNADPVQKLKTWLAKWTGDHQAELDSNQHSTSKFELTDSESSDASDFEVC